ncbi:hypothetical protein ACFUGD_24725 [Streptomyces sp. NPDC057217]|uniref:hypothetical protein n=1 Tax=unclassified Streptomyces TaxID=2593676 RepID=UPI00362B7D8A
MARIHRTYFSWASWKALFPAGGAAEALPPVVAPEGAGVSGAEATKLLAAGPPPAERRDGLTTLVQGLGGYTATGSGTRVTVRLEDPYAGNGRDQATGQLVCTLARAQSVLEAEVRAEDVEVTLRPPGGPAVGLHRCADFLTR